MRKISSLILITALFVSKVFAQTGELQGKVTDDNTKEGVSFANVILVRNGNVITGNVADIDGDYIIKPVVPGSYELRVFGISTDTVVVTNIQISADKITYQNIT